MTPQEQAKKLIERFENGLTVKDCALIAVDFAKEFITGDLDESFDKILYLFEVKQEIENL